MKLVFNEEFNEDGPPNKDRWKYDLADQAGGMMKSSYDKPFYLI